VRRFMGMRLLELGNGPEPAVGARSGALGIRPAPQDAADGESVVRQGDRSTSTDAFSGARRCEVTCAIGGRGPCT
jgi:hypothetical protein